MIRRVQARVAAMILIGVGTAFAAYQVTKPRTYVGNVEITTSDDGEWSFVTALRGPGRPLQVAYFDRA